MTDDYELLDAGDGRKLERFGRYVLQRPCSQALWRPSRPDSEWSRADAAFDREDGNRWHGRGNLPKSWQITTAGIVFKLGGARVLNLFAYSGGSTLAAALGGAEACHLDAAKGMVDWARENAALNGLSGHPIRWIVDDAHKFMRREIRRGRSYDAIILDPPTFGRGAGGELYKIERDLKETLALVKDLLSDKPLFVLFSSHTPGLSPIVAENILGQLFPTAKLDSGEMLLEGRALPCPSGIYCRAVWQ